MTLCLASQTILAGTGCHVFVWLTYNLARSGPLIFLIFVKDETCLKTECSPIITSFAISLSSIKLVKRIELCSVGCQMSWFLFCSWLFHRELFIIT